MNIKLLPTTKLGKWSIWSCLALFILLAIFMFGAIIGPKDQNYEAFIDAWWLAIPLLLAGACGTMALVTGLISIIRSKERALLVFASSFIGLNVTFFWLGEVLVPH
jgi:bacteriorhodopsin